MPLPNHGGAPTWRTPTAFVLGLLIAGLLLGCGDIERRQVQPGMVGVVVDETDLEKKQPANSGPEDEPVADEPVLDEPVADPEPKNQEPRGEARTRRAAPREQRATRVTARDTRAGAALRNEPLLVPLDTYFWAGSRIELLNMENALKLYQASHGSYPKSHDEFMKEIVQKNGIHLPELKSGWEYFYDAEDHTLKQRRVP